MKKIAKFLAVVIAASVFCLNASAQLTATSSATAVIYSALTITNTQDLDFGVIIPSGVAGTVAMDAAGAVTLTNVTAHPSSNPLPAVFHVVGEPGETYDIAITNPPITLTGPGANTMTISAIVSNPAEGLNAGLLDGTGVQDISVGGTLNVGINQAAGTYTNANAITVTINYN